VPGKESFYEAFAMAIFEAPAKAHRNGYLERA
jgi:hypothetical protein